MHLHFGRKSSLVVAALVVVGAAAAASGMAWRAEANDSLALNSQAETIAKMRSEMTMLEARAAAQPEWPGIATAVERSVVTISTEAGLGSGWVVHANAIGSDIVTNFHVVEEAVSAGIVAVNVLQFDRTMQGTIVRVDRNDDLALVHIDVRLDALEIATLRPRLGSTVMAVGSPLGLDGTISIGVVSGFRSLGGSDYVQFSAAISPGNSGGPLVDSGGHVVGIVTAKLVGEGVDALGFAIPVETACLKLSQCAHL
jgi:putative serine protease PepD